MLWLKAFHIIAIVAWFAALFYLPRLFVYHAMPENKASWSVFCVMEHKLYYYIMYPAGLMTTLSGYGLIFLRPIFHSANWMHVKLFLVLLLWIFHLICGHFLRLAKQQALPNNHVFFRWFNEFPTIILIITVCLAILQPVFKLG